jgi:hypothetical protein
VLSNLRGLNFSFLSWLTSLCKSDSLFLLPENVRDTLAKQHLIEALADSEMRIPIKQSRPQNFNDAIRLAVELETFNRAERRVTEGRSYLRLQYYPVYYL